MKNKTVQVSFHTETEKSYAVLVDLHFDESGHNYAASRVELFPKSSCSLEKEEVEGKRTKYFLTAPEWLLKDRKVNY